MVTARHPLERFAALPSRLFLDSSVLQTLVGYGEVVFEHVPLEPSDRAYRVRGLPEDLDALRVIFQVNQRAGFDMVLSENSLVEVSDKCDSAYMRWALDVFDHWLCRIEEYSGRAFDGSGVSLATRVGGPEFGYLSAKDRALLSDAVALECDAFLTRDLKLAKKAGHIHAVIGIHVLRPADYLEMLRPWIALFV